MPSASDPRAGRSRRLTPVTLAGCGRYAVRPDSGGPGILERIDPRPADTGLPGQVALSETLPLASSPDHAAQFHQIGHTRTTIEVNNSPVTSTMGGGGLKHKAFLKNWRYLP